MVENDEPKNRQGVPLCPSCNHTWHGLGCHLWCPCPTSCMNLNKPEDEDWQSAYRDDDERSAHE